MPGRQLQQIPIEHSSWAIDVQQGDTGKAYLFPALALTTIQGVRYDLREGECFEIACDVSSRSACVRMQRVREFMKQFAPG